MFPNIIKPFVLFAFLVSLPVMAHDDEIRADMESEFEKIEQGIKTTNDAPEAEIADFVSDAFDSSFGFSSYLKVMDMLHRWRFASDVARIVQETRLVYSERGYANADTETILATMRVKGAAINNPYGGRFDIGPAPNGIIFCIQASGIKSDECIHFSNMKWEGVRAFDGSDNGGKAIVVRGDFEGWKPPAGKGSSCSREKDAKHTLYLCYR